MKKRFQRLTLSKIFSLSNLEKSWLSIASKLKAAPFRDVIDYRDYHFFIKQKIKRLRYDILSIKYRPVPSVRPRSQKSKGLNRVLTYFHPDDLTVYNLLCEVLYTVSRQHYHKNIFFSRSRQYKEDSIIKTEGYFLDEPYGGTFKQWKKFSKHRASLGNKGNLKMAAITDISNFFELIHHATVRDVIFPYFKNPEIVNLFLMFLENQIKLIGTGSKSAGFGC